MSKSGALYISNLEHLKKAKSSRLAVNSTVLLLAFTIIAALFTIAPTKGSPPIFRQANAFGCGGKTDLGNSMKQMSWQGNGGSGAPGNTGTNRYWTLQEVVGNSAAFTNYHGEGDGNEDWFVSDVGTERGTGTPGFTDKVSEFETHRSLGSCLGGGLLSFIGTVGLEFAGIVSSFTTFVATSAFNSKLICASADDTTGSCINLLKVIGGTNKDVVENSSQGGGIITSLTSGIYLPLLMIVTALSGMWVLWIGIVKRKYREAMFGALWVFGSIIFGLTILFKPYMLAKAPMAVSNTVVTCVVGAFNGNSCTDPGVAGYASTDGGPTSQNICVSHVSGIPVDEYASMTVNSLSCSIWKAFILEPWSRGSFGRSFAELDIENEDVKAAAQAAGINPQDFCFNLNSRESYNSQGSTLNLNSSGNRICNIAAYQLFLMTNATSTGVTNGTSMKGPDTPDTRWYPLIVTTSNDSGMWNAWSSGGFSQIGTGMLAVITAIVGGVIIIVISLFALVYYLISVILMAFAPLFLLFGVHPGRGKKIMIGWAEMVVSNILKYLASALFLIVTIQLYAAVLGTSTNNWLTLLFVIILSGALFLYRKEVVELMGQVNAGGERMSGALADKIKSGTGAVTKKTGRIAGATVGAAVGARLATGSAKDVIGNARSAAQEQAESQGLEGADADRYIKEQVDAAKTKRSDTLRNARREGLRREIKTGGKGFAGQVVSQTTRQYERTSADAKRDVQDEAREARVHATDLRDSANRQEQAVDTQVAETEELENKAQEATFKVELVQGKENEGNLRSVEDRSIANISGDHPEFAKMMEITNKLERLKQDRAVAASRGDLGRVAAIDEQSKADRRERSEIKKNLSQVERNSGAKAYGDSIRDELNTFSPAVAEEVRNHKNSDTREGYVKDLGSEARAHKEFDDSLERLHGSVDTLNETRTEAARATVREKELGKRGRGFSPGEIVKETDTQKANVEIDRKVEKASAPEYELKDSWQRGGPAMPSESPTPGPSGPTPSPEGPSEPTPNRPPNNPPSPASETSAPWWERVDSDRTSPSGPGKTETGTPKSATGVPTSPPVTTGTRKSPPTNPETNKPRPSAAKPPKPSE